MKSNRLLFYILFILLIIWCYSCKKEEKPAPIQIILSDAPGNFDAVNVHIKDIKVNIGKDDTSWISIHAKDSIYNLLDLQNGISTIIAQDTIPNEIIKEIRLILGPDNTIVMNGTTYTLQTPSAEESGLKIKLNKKLNETLNTFKLDFDAALSIKSENGVYRLSPVIRLK
jgi:hypothetical protein